MKTASRREFLITGASALALSGAIFKSVQGWLNEGRQYIGQNLHRPLDGPLTPPASAQIDPVAHALNRWTFGPGPGDYARVAALGTDAFLEEQLAPEKIDDGLCDRAIASRNAGGNRSAKPMKRTRNISRRSCAGSPFCARSIRSGSSSR